MTKKIISFQGQYGAFSDLACRAVFPNETTLPCNSFFDAFQAVQDSHAHFAMIPIDNTIAGRVADVHYLLPRSPLFIVGEHFQPVSHNLLGVKGASIEDIKHIHSHVHALPQCRKILKELGTQQHVTADTAGSAKYVAEKNDPAHAAIASSLAAEIYGLDILKSNVQDEDQNTTRFLILAPEPLIPEYKPEQNYITSLMFRVRNIPAALYKSLGGFATGGISMAKLESYVDANFQAAEFYCDVEGHSESEAFQYAIEELGFYAEDVKLLGTYIAHPFRQV